jgi:hypothetical protein
LWLLRSMQFSLVNSIQLLNNNSKKKSASSTSVALINLLFYSSNRGHLLFCLCISFSAHLFLPMGIRKAASTYL